MTTRKVFATALTILLLASAPALALPSRVNPFVDLPANHWAYDALTQLAARGILSGYGDGTFKGKQPLTRYEASSMTARALAVMDMSKASKQDMEMMKKLVVEFKYELDALGVKASELDSRVAVLEDNLGGWQFWGEFRFDGQWGGHNDGLYSSSLQGGRNEFKFDRARLWMRKQVDENVTFTTRLSMSPTWERKRIPGGDTWENQSNADFDLFWVDVKFPWNWEAKIGDWEIDWSASDGTWADNDSMFSNRILRGFYLYRPWGSGQFAAYAARDINGDYLVWDRNTGATFLGKQDTAEWGARLRLDFTPDVFASLNFISRKPDEAENWDDFNSHVLWGTLGTTFAPGFEGRFSYYSQSLGDNLVPVGFRGEGDNPAMWHGAVWFDQSRLGFTSLRLEYMKPDENFRAWTDGPYDLFGAPVTGLELGRYDSIFYLGAEQKWSDQWSTFERYIKGTARWNTLSEQDGTPIDSGDTTNWTLGVRYRYTPALSFELAYDNIKNSEAVQDRDDHLVRFRTTVSF